MASWPVVPWERAELGRSAVSTFGLPCRQKDGSAGSGAYQAPVDSCTTPGGGRITDVIHSDATQLQAWEKFTLYGLGNGVYDIQTINGHYLTAVGGGGRANGPIHSDATSVGAWEKFTITCGH